MESTHQGKRAFIHELDGHDLYKAFVQGANQVIHSRKLLNNINFFPVADSDTGNNLTLTLSGMKELQQVSSLPRQALASIADACLLGARGNSGLILSQYFNGLAECCPPTETLTLEQFSLLITKASKKALQAITNPVNGTMITLMQFWSDCCRELIGKSQDFCCLFEQSVASLKQALNATAKLQPLAGNTKVVDAGAKGFYLFIEGIKNALLNTVGTEEEHCHHKDESESFEHMPHEHSDAAPTFRYCTEAIVVSDDYNIKSLQETLGKYGDSIVVAGRDKRYRIHLHSNVPAQVFAELGHASYQNPKVDDMWKQYQVAHVAKQSIALVTDSIADLPAEFIDKHHIHIIPAHLLFGDSVYLDKLTINAESFYKRVDTCAEYPTSAIPSLGMVKNAFDFLSAHYQEILVLTVSSTLSGFFNLMSQVARDYANTHVVDTRTSSGAQGLMVKRCAELIASQQYTCEEIVALLGPEIERAHLFVSVNNFKYLARSGRVTSLQGSLANLMHLKPVIVFGSDGRGRVMAKPFSRGKALDKIVQLVSQNHKENPVSSYCLLHANAEEASETLGARLEESLGMASLYTMQVSPVVGLHAGVGAVGVATYSQSET